MNPLYQSLLSQAVSGQMLNVRDLSQFSAAEIRQTMADLVVADRTDLANALAAAGQSLYPESEDILAISALLAEVQQDWANAQELLLKLIEVQGDAATPVTLRHLIRVLRCQCEPAQAMQVAQKALALHPQDASLQEEFASLQDLFSEQLPLDASSQIH
jgi:tetratricopeptide (TPR) repeat protein